MKSYKFLVPLIFVVAMLFPMALFAQEATPEVGNPISIVQALQIVQAQYGTDMVITEISFYSDEEDDDAVQTACWHFEFADGTELCVDAYTGTIVVDDLEAEETPEAEETEDANDDGEEADDEDDSNDDGEEADDEDDSSDDDDVNDDDGEDTVTLTPVVSLEEAIALALSIYPNSIVTNVDLEVLDDGTLVWDVELDNDLRSVDIDATTGAVLDFGYEEDDDNGYYEDDDSNDDDGSDDDVNDDDDSNDDDDGSDDDDSNDDDEEDDDDDDSSDDDEEEADDDDSSSDDDESDDD